MISRRAYRSHSLERVLVDVGEDVGFGVGQDLKGDGAVVVLQRRDVVVADRKVRARVDLISERRNEGRNENV